MGVAEAILDRAEVDSFWKLNEAAGPTYADSVGAVTGTEFQFPLDGQNPIVPNTADTSVFFDRNNPDAITFGNVYDFTGSATFTAYCWLKPTVFDSSNGNWLWGNRDAATRGWSLEVALSGGTTCALRMSRGDAAGLDQVDYLITEAVYENGIPKQVAMSYDGTDLILNMDGVDVQSGASSRSLVAPTTNTDLNFGRYGGGGSGYTGYAQYLAIFSPNLVEADLLDLRNSALSSVAWITA